MRLQVPQRELEKPASDGAIVTMVVNSVVMRYENSPEKPLRRSQYQETGAATDWYVPGAMCVPTWYIPVPKTVTGAGG